MFLLVSPAASTVTPPQPTKITPYERGGSSFTGDLNLDLPLMDVPSTGGLSLPIVAHYESGIKVDQLHSIIGLGWNLDLGSIRRIPMNLVDYHDTAKGGSTSCGDQICNGPETHNTCPKDCTGTTSASDNICECGEYQTHPGGLQGGVPACDPPNINPGGLDCTNWNHNCEAEQCTGGTSDDSDACPNIDRPCFNPNTNYGWCWPKITVGQDQVCPQLQDDTDCYFGGPGDEDDGEYPCKDQAGSCWTPDYWGSCSVSTYGVNNEEVCFSSECYDGNDCEAIYCASGNVDLTKCSQSAPCFIDSTCTQGCGNGVCDIGETWFNCNLDCWSQTPSTSDGTCQTTVGGGENYYCAPSDCAAVAVGSCNNNGRCEFGESYDGANDLMGSTSACPNDCREDTIEPTTYSHTRADVVGDAMYVTFPSGGDKFFNFGTVENPEFEPKSANTPYRLNILGTTKTVQYGYDYDGFVLITADGTKFVYNQPVKESYVDAYDNGDVSRLPASPKGAMEWKLTAILSPGYRDSAGNVLDPTDGNNAGSWIAINYDVVDYHYDFDGTGPDSRVIYREIAYPNTVTTSSGHTATFTFVGDGVATPANYLLSEYEIDYNSDGGSKEATKHLNSITLSKSSTLNVISFVYNQNNNLASGINEYSPTVCIDNDAGNTIPDGTHQSKLMLTQINVQGKTAIDTLEPYEFAYNPGPALLPGCSRTSLYDYRDLFGYYTSNPDGMNLDSEGAFAGVDLADAEVWSLYKISYPTGLKVTYNYETHKINQQFNIVDTRGNTVFQDNDGQYIYRMGGARLISTTVEDPSGDSYVYTQDYLAESGIGDAGNINRIPDKFVQERLSATGDYYFLPSSFDDVGEFVYYPKTKLTLPGGIGHIITYYSTDQFESSGKQSTVFSGSFLCFYHNSRRWCENIPGKQSATLIPDKNDGFMGYPELVRYYKSTGSFTGDTTLGLVKEVSVARGSYSNNEFETGPITVEDPAYDHTRTALFWKTIDLPDSTTTKLYDWTNPSYTSISSISYSYASFARTGQLPHETIILSTGTTLTPSSGAAKTTSISYAFASDPDTNVKDRLSNKFMLTLPSQINSPGGLLTKTEYKVYE
ncbi:MAG: hypothetical protein ABIJ92_00965 [Candidatus Aenigmatarchaeota archaeon]